MDNSGAEISERESETARGSKMSSSENFADGLNPDDVQTTLDALPLPWRDKNFKENEGWVTFNKVLVHRGGEKHLNDCSISVNVYHGGFVDQYERQMAETYDESHKRPHESYTPEKGDLVTLVQMLRGLRQKGEAIKWIKDVIGMKSKSRSKIHFFSVADAEDHTVKAAVILQNLRTWLDKNLASKNNIRDGRVWTHIARKNFTRYHPYLTENQVRYQLDKLEDDGIIISKRLNKKKWDQVLFYSVNEPDYMNLENEITYENGSG